VKYFVQRVALFWVRLVLLVVTAIALMAVEFEHGMHISDVGSPLVVFHRLEWAVLPLLVFGWFLVWGASRALRQDRDRRAS
jgi:hypothetical protein